MSTKAADPWEATVAQREPGDPAWLVAHRRAALEAFRAQGYPTPRTEAWRSTSVAPIARTAWRDAPAAARDVLRRAGALVSDLDAPAEEAARVVLANGRVAPSLGRADDLPAGVVAGALAEHAQDVEHLLGTLLDVPAHPFAALNEALFPEACLLRVPRGVELSRPVHVVCTSVGTEEGQASHPRLLVHVGAGAKASVVLTFAGSTRGSFLSNAAVEIWLEDGARLDWLEVQSQTRETNHLLRTGAYLGRDSSFAACCVAVGAKLGRTDLGVTLGEEGAHCRLDGVTIASGRQHLDVQTLVDHAQPHGTSQQLWKGILDDHASSVFGGRVLVRPHAQKTDARQANHNLLLSRDAVADSKPMLEIFADDVKCAHGATVGQLDEEALFYLRTRAIGLEGARALLVRAFANDVADRVEHPALGTLAHAVVARRLGAGS